MVLMKEPKINFNKRREIMKPLSLIGVIILSFIVVAFSAFVLALPTMWLWNWLMPVIFGLTKISFWQALGLNLLCGLLFKGTTTVNKS